MESEPQTPISIASQDSLTQRDFYAYVGNFCDQYVPQKLQLNDLQKRRKDITRKKSDIHKQLLEYMQANGLTCVGITINDEPQYLRLFTKNNRTSLNDEVVTKIVQQINNQVIASTLQNKKPEKKAKKPPVKKISGKKEKKEEAASQEEAIPSLYQVLVDSLLNVTDNVCIRQRQSVSITKSRERTCKSKLTKNIESENTNCNTIILPSDILESAVKLHKCDEELEPLNVISKQCRANLNFLSKGQLQNKPKSKEPLTAKQETTRKRKAKELKETNIADEQKAPEEDENHKRIIETRHAISSVFSNGGMKRMRVDCNVINEMREIIGKNGKPIKGTPQCFVSEKNSKFCPPFPLKEYKNSVAKAWKAVFENKQFIGDINLDTPFHWQHIPLLLDQKVLDFVEEKILDDMKAYREAHANNIKLICVDVMSETDGKKLEKEDEELKKNSVIVQGNYLSGGEEEEGEEQERIAVEDEEDEEEDYEDEEDY